MKEILGKKKYINQVLPKQILVDKIKINDAKSIAENFNEFMLTWVQTWLKKSCKVTLILNLIFQK